MFFTVFLTPSFIILFFLNPLKNIQKDYTEVKVGEKLYKMEVANTKYKQALGLMFKDYTQTKGMVFVYTKPTNPLYYNKNVKFPLRIYFIDKDMVIKAAYIMQKDSFKTYSPGTKISYVVEIPLNDDLSGDPGENPEIKVIN